MFHTDHQGHHCWWDKFINLVIPHMKTEVNETSIYISDSMCGCSAISTFEYHLLSNYNMPASSPLFAFETLDGSWTPMTRTWFLDSCNEVWAKEGLTSVKGHSFWIGSTTHLLLLRVNPWVVMQHSQLIQPNIHELDIRGKPIKSIYSDYPSCTGSYKLKLEKQSISWLR